MKYVFVGDSWALKAFTKENNNTFNDDTPMTGDIRLADHWGVPYDYAFARGKGNITILQKILKLNISSTTPIIWIYTEPGRDYMNITGNSEFEWMERDDIFDIRKQLAYNIFKKIKSDLPNPIAFIGGLSDIDVEMAESFGYTVLHSSWQSWIAKKNNSDKFKFGWGVGDIPWRMTCNGVIPSRAAALSSTELLNLWDQWEKAGDFCVGHPTLSSTKEFADDLKVDVLSWLKFNA